MFPQWGWVRLFSAKWAKLDKKGRNLEMKRAIWMSPTPTPSQRQRLQTPLWQKLGSHIKKQNSRFWAQKNTNFPFGAKNGPKLVGWSANLVSRFRSAGCISQGTYLLWNYTGGEEKYNCQEEGVVYMYRKFHDAPAGLRLHEKTDTWQECQKSGKNTIYHLLNFY